MRYGTVVQYFPAKGFGFIRSESGPDVFFHVTALGACEPQPQIKPGQPVKYELAVEREPKLPSPSKQRGGESARGAQGPKAKLVELIDRIPGAIRQKVATKQRPAHHPRARHKKPTWRR